MSMNRLPPHHAEAPVRQSHYHMDLRDYARRKFSIAGILRAASLHIPGQRRELRERLQGLFARLAEDRFNLVVVGRFNRGKTSLMNAILATNRLPTGIVPLTSVITTVGYGSKERVVLKYAHGRLDKEIPLASLPQHVTQQGNPGNVQGIATAEIQLPVEILRRGFYFVDTPGLGSVIAENTLTTEAFLPEADAFVLVTSYESPLSEEEIRFFKAASTSGRRIFVVLNKHDTVSADQRAVVVSFVREQLGRFFGREAPPIFSISSTDGLNAKLSGDQVSLSKSGIPELEARLLTFLLVEKSTEFLARMYERVGEFLWELPSSPEIAGLVAEVGSLAEHVDQDRSPTLQPGESSETFSGLHQVRTCEICRHIADALWDFLCKYQYEIAVNNEERERFAERGGLCPFHAWQLHSMASPYGLCIGYAPLLDRLGAQLRELAAAASVADAPAQIASLVPDEEECAVCKVRNGAETEAIAATARQLKTQGERAINALSAICIPHVAKLATAVQESDLVRLMLRRHATLLQRYAEDMQRYAIKHDAVRRYLASQEEITASERGVLLVTGRHQVNFVPRQGGVLPARDTARGSRKGD